MDGGRIARVHGIGTRFEGYAPLARLDPDSADLVRVRVRVLDGTLRGRTGWVAVAYTGIPVDRLPATAQVAEKACRCRLVQFENWGPSGGTPPRF